MTPVEITLRGLECTHEAMTECCPGCGHLSCPCGIEYDEHSEGAAWSLTVERETTGPTADDFD